MTQNVLISITGAQLTDDGPQEIELVTTGDYFGRNGKHYVVFEEVLEDGMGVIKNTIKMQPDALAVIKKGSAATQMIFEKNKKSESSYMTPFGHLTLGITTNDVRLVEREDLLRVDVDYSLDINYAHVSDCNITVSVRPRG